jgi:four helix bundle protein
MRPRALVAKTTARSRLPVVEIFDFPLWYRPKPSKKQPTRSGTRGAQSPRMGKEYDLRTRTMRFALDVRVVCRQLPDSYEGHHVRGQLFRAATAVAANYRAACRGRSKLDFIAKLGIAIEEADETDFWLDFGVQSLLLKSGTEVSLRKEADELLKIFIKSQITARENIERAEEEAKRRGKKAVPIATTGAVTLMMLVLQYLIFRIYY